MILLTQYIDRYGLITKSDGEGGDTAQREGMYEISRILRNAPSREIQGKLPFKKVLQLLRNSQGLYRRHPDCPHKAMSSNPYSMTSDNLDPLIIAMGMRDDCYRDITHIKDKHSHRAYFYWNRYDISGNKKPWYYPLDWKLTTPGMYARALGQHGVIDWAMILVHDVSVFFGTLWRVIKSYVDSDDVGNDLNLLLRLEQQKTFCNNPLAKLTNWIYRKFRANSGVPRLNGFKPAYTALWWYFRPSTGSFPMYIYWKPIIEENY
jgi:hypothetical protein